MLWVFLMFLLDFSILNDFFLIRNEYKEHTSSISVDSLVNTLSVTFMLFYRFFKIYCAYKLEFSK
jgi:hypothetical protein